MHIITEDPISYAATPLVEQASRSQKVHKHLSEYSRVWRVMICLQREEVFVLRTINVGLPMQITTPTNRPPGFRDLRVIVLDFAIFE